MSSDRDDRSLFEPGSVWIRRLHYGYGLMVCVWAAVPGKRILMIREDGSHDLLPERGFRFDGCERLS